MGMGNDLHIYFVSIAHIPTTLLLLRQLLHILHSDQYGCCSNGNFYHLSRLADCLCHAFSVAANPAFQRNDYPNRLDEHGHYSPFSPTLCLCQLRIYLVLASHFPLCPHIFIDGHTQDKLKQKTRNREILGSKFLNRQEKETTSNNFDFILQNTL